MNETSDESLRRLFAQAAEVAPDETFVAAVSTAVAARRSRRRLRRIGLAALLGMAAVTLSIWLAPYAPLSLPETLARVGEMAPRRLPALPVYLYLVIAAGVLPLLGTAWLLRRN